MLQNNFNNPQQREEFQANSQNFIYQKCQIQGHFQESLNLICMDYRCPQEKQFELLCSICQQEGLDQHIQESHKARNLKTVISSIQNQIDDADNQNQQNKNNSNKLNNSNWLDKIMKNLKIMQSYVQNTITKINEQNQKNDLEHKQLQSKILKFLKSENQNDQQQNLQLIRSSIQLDKQGISLRNSEQIENKDLNMQKILVQTEKINQIMENLSTFSENLKDSKLELTNLDLQDNSEMYKDIIANQDMEIQRLEQQFKNSKENLDIWKNKIKQQNNSFENNAQNLGIKNQQLKEKIQDLQTENSKKDQQIQKLKKDIRQIIGKLQNAKAQQQKDEIFDFLNSRQGCGSRRNVYHLDDRSGKKCRQGHILRDVKLNDDQYQNLICDECNEYLRVRSQEGQRCNECNYDICNNCQGKKLAAECANQ